MFDVAGSDFINQYVLYMYLVSFKREQFHFLYLRIYYVAKIIYLSM